ncbi:hypothetical protein [Tichowtungia aerotolerans]|uniref:Uncharacterized protein n=1 Tax=Tichowtungia aerotolerans TaxID=2697043 RepID=A0A6P1MAZ1_9BACT|nr:hypothetical protein [Tichowtungia aerotolerans]QHI68285.1 hypothetical protein GT409_02045 [Tichowtungia aerotolerans]
MKIINLRKTYYFTSIEAARYKKRPESPGIFTPNNRSWSAISIEALALQNHLPRKINKAINVIVDT